MADGRVGPVDLCNARVEPEPARTIRAVALVGSARPGVFGCRSGTADNPWGCLRLEDSI